MTVNDATTPLRLLATRRSAKPRDLTDPGPTDAQVTEIVSIAARVPDHGNLAPWRFVHIGAHARSRFAAILDDGFADANPGADDAKRDKARTLATAAPCLILVIATPKPSAKISRDEQLLSAGAACQNLLLAATAMGFAGGWITGWPAASARVRAALNLNPSDSIAGLLFIGTPAQPLADRPRPAIESILTRW